jgi:hypothetical protein
MAINSNEPHVAKSSDHCPSDISGLCFLVAARMVFGSAALTKRTKVFCFFFSKKKILPCFAYVSVCPSFGLEVLHDKSA